MKTTNRRRGYILVAFTLSLFFLLGVIGLCIDIGRMYVAKSESQSFCDAASLNAAVKLALVPGDFTTAKTAVTTTPKTWELATNTFSDITTLFGTNPDGPFIAAPPAGDPTYTFAQVTTHVHPVMYLMGVLVNSSTATVGASAVAGQQATTGLPNGGEFPFSPYSRKGAAPDDPNDPYGYKAGNTYTLRWGAKGGGVTSDCDSGLDEASGVAAGGSFRGYCCTGSNNVPDLARDIALGGGTVPINIGDPFIPLQVPGQKSVTWDAIEAYIHLDTDITSATYTQYRTAAIGNGKRLIVVPINGKVNGSWEVIGFAGFFLLTPGSYHKTPASGASWCAEYVGKLVQGLPGPPPPGSSGVYHLKIYR